MATAATMKSFKECQFCHTPLDLTPERPANLAFLRHVERTPSCMEAFSAWKLNMVDDAGGD